MAHDWSNVKSNQRFCYNCKAEQEKEPVYKRVLWPTFSNPGGYAGIFSHYVWRPLVGRKCVKREWGEVQEEPR